MEPRVDEVYVLEVQEPGDYLLQVSAIVIFYNTKRFEVYSDSANHNRFRSVIQKFSLEELMRGMHWKEAEYRLTVADFGAAGSLADDGVFPAVPTILQSLYRRNPRQLYFLRKYLSLSLGLD